MAPVTTINRKMQSVSCTILPGRYTTAQTVPTIYNDVYKYWVRTWSQFFEKAGSPPDSLNIENYMRHSFVIALRLENKIIGSLHSSLFNLGADVTYDHPCIKPYPKELLDMLREKGKGLCVTGEYLSADPEFRREVTGISLADVMIGLQMQVFLNLKLEIAFGAAVRAAKVDAICKKYGYREVGSYLKIGVDCIMLYNTQESYRTHPDSEVMEMVNRCWRNRDDQTGMTVPERENFKKSA